MLVMITNLLGRVLSLLVTLLIVYFLFTKGYFGTVPVYTLDVQKVLASYNALVGKAASNDLDSALKVTNSSQKILAAVDRVSDGRLVVITGAVVSGNTIDITDDVLELLGITPFEGEIQYLTNPEAFGTTKPDAEYDPDALRALMYESMRSAVDKAEEEESKMLRERIIP